jgi:cholesterol transport system auxiliary component
MRRAALVLVAALLSGCALTQKGEALAVRYFTPEHLRPRLTGAGGQAAGPELRLGRVTSGTQLREPIAYREGAYEVGYYDDRRWTERPEVYVRRALARVLFEERGLRRATAGDAPTLEIEVIAFEEVKASTLHAARVVLRVVLSADRTVVEDTIVREEPVPAGAPIDEVVAAIARALDGAADEVARRVEAALTR